jgi:hypothetical protein
MLSVTIVAGLANFYLQNKGEAVLDDIRRNTTMEAGLNASVDMELNNNMLSNNCVIQLLGDTNIRRMQFAIHNTNAFSIYDLQLTLQVPASAARPLSNTFWKIDETGASNDVILLSSSPLPPIHPTSWSRLTELDVLVPDGESSTNNFPITFSHKHSGSKRIDLSAIIPAPIYNNDTFTLDNTRAILSGTQSDGNYISFMRLSSAPVENTITVLHHSVSIERSKWRFLKPNIVIMGFEIDFESFIKYDPFIVRYTPDRSYTGQLAEIQSWGTTRVEIAIGDVGLYYSDYLRLVTTSDVIRELKSPPEKQLVTPWRR